MKVAGKNVSAVADTDGDGRFAITLEAGSYRLWVEHSGFAPQAYGSHTPDGTGTALTLAAGQQVRDINFRMAPLGAIAGHIFDEYGDPLQGAGIQVMRLSFARGRRQLVPVMGAGSNDRGEYRAFGLRAGRYFLLATLRDALASRPLAADALLPEMKESFAAVYYPGVLDFSSASQIALPEGGEISDADFHVQRTRAVLVRGRLLSPIQDFAGSRVQVVLAHSDGNTASSMNRNSAIIDEKTGRFEFHGVTPGSYVVVASQLHDGRSLTGRAPVEVMDSTAASTVNVPLMPAFDLAGTIEVEGGPSAELSHMTVQLVNSEGLALSQQPLVKVGPDGSFRLPGVTAGVWDFTLGALPDDLWIKSATLGGVDISRGEFNVFSAAKGMRIVLGRSGAQISGTVTQAGQPRRAVVLLAPAATELQGFARMYRSMPADENGTFFFRGAPPGTYKLFAFEEIETLAWLDPEFLKPVEALGEAISVAEGEKATRQLTLIPADALLPAR